MKKLLLCTAALLCLAASGWAAILPAEKLLPDDTLLVLTAPDSTKVRASFAASAQGQLWNDPSMKAFREKFASNFSADVVAPLEKALGVQFADYKDLAQGQFTFAITQNGWQGKEDQKLGMILLVDAKDKSGSLKTNLINLKKKWLELGKEVKTEKINEIEFNTLITTDKEISAALGKLSSSKSEDEFGEEPKDKAPQKVEITVGQVDSLLIVGNSTKLIEKILKKQAGGLVPSLSENATYEANHNTLFREAKAYAWLNIKPFIDLAKADAAENKASMMSPEKVMTTIGLNGLTTAAIAYNDLPEGALLQASIGAPEAKRQGLLKLLALEPKDANPPAFVPADAVKFSRSRLDLQKTVNGVEKMMGEISPMWTGVFKLVFDSAGKDQDPNYDLRKELIGNLGDDIISFQKLPRGTTLEDLNSPPTLYLLSSANPDRLANAVKIGMNTLSPEGTTIKDREFLGRKVYTFALPPAMTQTASGKPSSKSLHFAASGGYVGLSTDVAILEEYLRSSDSKAKSLAENPVLAQAAEKVGGMRTGMFSYEDQNALARVTLETLKKESGSLATLFGAPALGAKLGPDQENTKKWADFTLLPPYEQISKYFHCTVYTGAFDANGFNIRLFAPTPPQLKK